MKDWHEAWRCGADFNVQDMTESSHDSSNWRAISNYHHQFPRITWWNMESLFLDKISSSTWRIVALKHDAATAMLHPGKGLLFLSGLGWCTCPSMYFLLKWLQYFEDVWIIHADAIMPCSSCTIRRNVLFFVMSLWCFLFGWFVECSVVHLRFWKIS